MLVILLVIFTIFTCYNIYINKKIKDTANIVYLREPPSKDSPAYIGKVIKERADGNDIISTILDLNARKYIDIEIKLDGNKEKRILKNNSKNRILELEEHEQYLINRLFKKSDTIAFEDYINSSDFKRDFNTFDKILEKKTFARKKNNSKNIKQINKIIFLVIFIILGTTISYSLIQPVSYIVKSNTNLNEYVILIPTIIIAIWIYIAFLNIYIKHINISSKNTAILNIAYIFVFAVVAIVIVSLKLDKIWNALINELNIYKVILSFILAIFSLLYMLNIIRHEYKNNTILYILIFSGIIASILNSIMSICIVIVMMAMYSFYIIPKSYACKDDDYIYKWLCFKRFLEDFSTLNIQEENAIKIWDKYLIYAISLGVNKQIIKKYGKLSYINILTEDYYKKIYNEYIE